MPTPGVHLATGALASSASLTGQLFEPRSPYCPGKGEQTGIPLELLGLHLNSWLPSLPLSCT